MTKKAIWIGLTLSLLGFVLASSAWADEWDTKTVPTFSQPVEVQASKAAVPAITVDVADVDALKTAPIMAITPDEKGIPVTAAIQTTPLANVANRSSSAPGRTGVKPPGQSSRLAARQLPKTASALPLIVLLGLGFIGVAFGLMVFGKHDTASAL